MTKNQEDEIRKCFICINVGFHYPNDEEELNLLIEIFQNEIYDDDQNTDSDSKIDPEGCNIFRENKKYVKLIVMDDVSGPADNSNNFANFLTVN